MLTTEPVPFPFRKSRLSAAAAAAILAFLQPRAARADNDITYEHEAYQEFGGRMGIQTSSVLAEQDLGTDMHLKLSGVLDTIAGATPTGQPAPAGSDQVVTTPLHDRRHAWDAEFTRQFSRIAVTAGFARSIEHDYMSNGWSLSTATDFNQKNTTLTVGASGTDDNVEVFFKPAWLRKVSNDVLIGVDQLLNPLTKVSLDFTWSRETGFLDDQYKLVQEDIVILPGIPPLPETFAESRPNERSKGDLLAAINRDLPSLNAALEGTVRVFHDTYGIQSEMAQLLWFQHVIGERLILRPNLRIYRQSAANFYYYRLDGTGIVPSRIPNPNLAYSSDARLSAFDSYDFGIKAIGKLTDWFTLDLGIDGYRQRGTDGITPQSAYYRARIVSFGGKVSW